MNKCDQLDDCKHCAQNNFMLDKFQERYDVSFSEFKKEFDLKIAWKNMQSFKRILL